MTLTTTQRLLRDLRLVAARTFGAAGRSKPRQLEFHLGQSSELRIVENGITLAFALAKPSPTSEGFALDLNDIRPFEAAGDNTVTIERTGNRSVRVLGEGISRELRVTPIESTHAERPRTSDVMPTDILRSLAEASRMADPHSLREGLRCLALDGRRQTLEATDGRKAIQFTSIDWPWSGRVLVARNGWFDHPVIQRAARRGTGFSVGLGDHSEDQQTVRFVAGPWSLALPSINHRFPDVSPIMPIDDSADTVIALSDDARADLGRGLKQLPTFSKAHPDVVTLESNATLLLRVGDGERVVEKPIASAFVDGRALTLAVGRHVLQDVVRLGLSELRIASPDQPVWGSSGSTRYVAMPLHPELVVSRKQTTAEPRDVPQTAR